jgi:hypothetical protein
MDDIVNLVFRNQYHAALSDNIREDAEAVTCLTKKFGIDPDVVTHILNTEGSEKLRRIHEFAHTGTLPENVQQHLEEVKNKIDSRAAGLIVAANYLPDDVEPLTDAERLSILASTKESKETTIGKCVWCHPDAVEREVSDGFGAPLCHQHQVDAFEQGLGRGSLDENGDVVKSFTRYSPDNADDALDQAQDL